MRAAPNPYSAKVVDIPAQTVVETTGQYETYLMSRTVGVVYEEIVYRNSSRTFTGWVPGRYLEVFEDPFPDIVKIDNPTPNPNDADQYVLSYGYNLCGQFCVCYCAGWEYSLEKWLVEWKSSPGSVYNRIFKGGKGTTTGIADLDNMLAYFDGYLLPSKPLGEALTDDLLDRPLLTPGRIAMLLKKDRIIISCHIETNKGRLQNTGVLHWVVVESITPNRFGGLVTIYNPFPNTLETYTWDQFSGSTGTPFGILVER